MSQSFSIAEAKNRFPELVRTAEETSVVKITRRGKAVAVLISTDEYERLQTHRAGFWDAYVIFRQQLEEQGIEINPDEVFVNVRDKNPSREVAW